MYVDNIVSNTVVYLTKCDKGKHILYKIENIRQTDTNRSSPVDLNFPYY